MTKVIVAKQKYDMSHMMGQFPDESHYDFLIEEINAMLCKIMHERIDAKYAPKKWEPELSTEYIAL